jgi:D-lyxose ketol-isomerase
MKRSEINAAIQLAAHTLHQHGCYLPPFAFWTPRQWSEAGAEVDNVRENRLGWDVSDFGRGEFDRLGAVLFTLRNGRPGYPGSGTPYAEKLIVMKPGQRMPMHFHWSKTEDIINRAGGVLVMQVYNSRSDDSVDRTSEVKCYCDGAATTVPAGGLVELLPGESITIPPRLYHLFWAREDSPILVCGEVSTINDDETDNCFAEPVSRFAEIDEDVAPLYLLCNEYPRRPASAPHRGRQRG